MAYSNMDVVDNYNTKKLVSLAKNDQLLSEVISGFSELYPTMGRVADSASELLEKYGSKNVAKAVFTHLSEHPEMQKHETLKALVDKHETGIKTATEGAYYATAIVMTYLMAKAAAEITMTHNAADSSHNAGNEKQTITHATNAVSGGGSGIPILGVIYHILSSQTAQAIPSTEKADLYGTITNVTADSNLTITVFNQSTGDVAAQYKNIPLSESDGEFWYNQNIFKGDDPFTPETETVSEGDNLQAWINGTIAKLESTGESNWSVSFENPTENVNFIYTPSSQIPPKIEDFFLELITLDKDSKKNDARIIANRSGDNTNYTLKINDVVVATNETYSTDTIHEIQKNLTEGTNSIKLVISTEDGRNPTITREVNVDTIAPYLIGFNETTSVNIFDDNSIEFLLNLSENSNWTLKRDGIKIYSNKTNSTQNPIPLVIKDMLEKKPAENNYTIDLKDESGNVNATINLGTYTPLKKGGGPEKVPGEPKTNIIKPAYTATENLVEGEDIEYIFGKKIKGVPTEFANLTGKSNINDDRVKALWERLHNISLTIVGDDDPNAVYDSIINEIDGEIVEMMNIKLGTDMENVQDLKFSRHYREIDFGAQHAYYVKRDTNNELEIIEVTSELFTDGPNDPTVSFNVSNTGFYVVSDENT